MKRAIGIAGGKQKLNAIRGALQGRLMNVLITDHFTAQHLLQEAENDGRLTAHPPLSSVPRVEAWDGSEDHTAQTRKPPETL